MKNRKSGSRRLTAKPEPHEPAVNDPHRDLWLYARSFHNAAKKLAGALEVPIGPFDDFDAGPVVFMYRHTVELHLKVMVLGEGGLSMSK